MHCLPKGKVLGRELLCRPEEGNAADTLDQPHSTRRVSAERQTSQQYPTPLLNPLWDLRRRMENVTGNFQFRSPALQNLRRGLPDPHLRGTSMPEGRLTTNKEPRDFTVEERREKFMAYKQKLAAKADADEEATHWHKVDDPLTFDQQGKLPDGHPGKGGRTRLIWLKYHHLRRREIVVAKGYFDYGDGNWMARYEPEDDGDIVRLVVAIAWAYIEADVKPWDGTIIPTRLRE
jgi:hypothetical protein